jgi:hypothetical protein
VATLASTAIACSVITGNDSASENCICMVCSKRLQSDSGIAQRGEEEST